MSQLEVDKIIPSSGTTLTIGDSGDTINISDGTALTVDTNTLAIDQANNRVGVGVSSPSFPLHVSGKIYGSGVVASAGNSFELSDNNVAIKRATDDMTLNTGGTERIRIDSSGNVGIGTSSPAKELHVYASSGECAIQVEGNAGDAGLNLKAVSTSASFVNFGDESTINVGQIYYSHAGNAMQFKTNATERMRIDNSGNVLVGRTDNPSGVSNCIYALGNYGITTGSGANVFINSEGLFFRSTSSLKYKNTIQDSTNGLAELLTLRPVTYKGNNDGDKIFGGLIAEEVHDAGLTEFVEYDDKGNPDALHYGNMVSLCIKAIQELKADNDALRARIEALENA